MKDHFLKWMSSLSPIYGEREANNMWRWYEEADRSGDLFEHDLSRLVSHYPIQYLTGYSYFYGEKFFVNNHSLIPRPETEELVYRVLENHPHKSDQLQVLDLGTGSGCIAITLKKQRPEWDVTGVDLYPETLAVAEKNSRLHQVDINWKQTDMLAMESRDIPHSYDIVVSNPPYISPDEKSLLKPNVRDYEPHEALFTKDASGLEFYKAIAEYGKGLGSGAVIYLEMHENARGKIVGLFNESQYYSTPEVIPDMQGKDRIFRVQRC